MFRSRANPAGGPRRNRRPAARYETNQRRSAQNGGLVEAGARAARARGMNNQVGRLFASCPPTPPQPKNAKIPPAARPPNGTLPRLLHQHRISRRGAGPLPRSCDARPG